MGTIRTRTHVSESSCITITSTNVTTANLEWGPDFGGENGDHLESCISVNLSDISLNISICGTISTNIENISLCGNLSINQCIGICEYLAGWIDYGCSVVSNCCFSNPCNSLNNTTCTAATICAQSDGLLCLTSNTCCGTIVVDFANPTILICDCFIIDGCVIIHIEREISNGGILPSGQDACMLWQISINGGCCWITIQNDTCECVPKGIVCLDISCCVGVCWNNINNLQVRATGSVTSGTGTNAIVTAHFYRTWITFNATKGEE